MLACLPFHNKIWAGEVLITSPDCSPRTAQYPEYIQLYRKKCFYYFHTMLQMIAEQGTQQLGDINDFWRESSQWHRSLFSLSTKVGSRQIHPQPFTPLCTYFFLFHPLIPLHICRSLTLPPLPLCLFALPSLHPSTPLQHWPWVPPPLRPYAPQLLTTYTIIFWNKQNKCYLFWALLHLKRQFFLVLLFRYKRKRLNLW